MKITAREAQAAAKMYVFPDVGYPALAKNFGIDVDRIYEIVQWLHDHPEIAEVALWSSLDGREIEIDK